MAKSKDDKKTRSAADAKAKVTLFNRTRAEITLESDGREPFDYEVGGRAGVGGCVTIPGTPKYSLTPTPVVVDVTTWEEVAKRKAVQAMVDAGQLEVR